MQVYSLSVCARATLDMHSLNNEGGEGNQIQTRMVDIVGADGRLYSVNAISGDMLKHIQAEHFYHMARQQEGLPLCAACQLFDANRISADQAYIDAIEGQSDGVALDLMLQRCAMDDIEGNLITSGNRSTPRKSVVEFGWVVGVPEVTTTSSYFHVKYATERGQVARDATKEEETRKANLGQIPFHRPASSGIYAIVNHYEISRIGYNDITQLYAIDDKSRKARYRALLESALYTFLEPNGAMRAAQLPHLVTLEGMISVSTQVVPAPTISPLGDDYMVQMEGVAAALNSLRPGAIVLRPFRTLAEFAAKMQELINEGEPFTLSV